MNSVPPYTQFDQGDDQKLGQGSSLTWRRCIFAVLFVATFAGLFALMHAAFSMNGISTSEYAMLGLFAVMLPWTIVGFWNAIIGLTIMRIARNPAGYVNPAAAQDFSDSAIHAQTAILVCIRNEAPERVACNLDRMIEALVAEGVAGSFHAYVLSDSSWQDVILDEQAAFDQLQRRWAGTFQVTYRRRHENIGYKAGNIRDFCERWGGDHDFALVLDADSVMMSEAVLRLVRIMQADPKLGIAQSLVVGLPSASLFTRIFQFGMRLGMRSYTIGSAWWQGDCGPYWGHNAVIRLAPFIEHCHLPDIPGRGPLSGCILSHDQVEAALMRRAGYHVRTIADEKGSWEENPPNLLEFVRRELRWCHGNMQYLYLLALRGLRPISRVQLLLAIMMFVSAPAWIAFVVLAGVQFASADDINAIINPQYGIALFAIVLGMVFSPKLATVTEVLLNPTERRSFGGGFRVSVGAFSELIFSMILAPVIAIANTVFLAGLLFGVKAGWPAQDRDNHLVPFDLAFWRLWPQTIFGVLGVLWMLEVTGTGMLFVLPVIVGPLISVPFTVLTSWPVLGRYTCRLGLWQIPEEVRPAPMLLKLDLEPYGLMHPEMPNIDIGTMPGSAEMLEAQLVRAKISDGDRLQ